MSRLHVAVKAKEGAHLPAYGTEQAAGADVCAHIEAPQTLKPGERALFGTGLFFEIPEGYEIQVRPRSGLALKHGITLVNSPATIDSDYRGELRIILINHGTEPFTVEPNMRIAQILVAPVERAAFIAVEHIGESQLRSSAGFGSTGLKAL